VLLEAAFDEAWLTLKSIGNKTVKPDELARSVLRLAMEGERDSIRLHDEALKGLPPATAWREASSFEAVGAGASIRVVSVISSPKRAATSLSSRTFSALSVALVSGRSWPRLLFVLRDVNEGELLASAVEMPFPRRVRALQQPFHGDAHPPWSILTCSYFTAGAR